VAFCLDRLWHVSFATVGTTADGPSCVCFGPWPRPLSSCHLPGTISNAVSVLVVAGACGIAAGTPLAIVGGIGKAARRGCIIKGMNADVKCTTVQDLAVPWAT
jgi:cation transport ATPase